jgi:hypothetical protein
LSQPFTTLLVLDFETAWCRKSGYSLSVMTTEDYIRDERFKAWGVCIHEYGTDRMTHWYRHDELPRIFSTYDWSKTAVVAQNALFDASILAWVYDVHPCFIFDTLSMARARRGTEIGNSLAKLAKAFNLPDKGGDLYLSESYFDELPEGVEHKLAEYCKHDVWLCEQVFSRLIDGYPTKELRLIDMTIKMYTEAKLVLDTPMLVDALHAEKEKREALLARLNIDESVLASNAKFAAVLEELGVPAPRKKSKTTGKSALALAKNDAMFQALLNGENEEVALLCEARINVKSTTERTRAQRFLDISRRGPLPVPLAYYGASTGRWTACLVADTEVMVYDRHNGQCVKQIVDVLPDDLVWDGVEFVQHEGVQFSGYKEVITYDGITGTPDHKVFLDDETTVSLFEAQQRGQSIMDAAEPDDRALEVARARRKRLRW